MTQQDLERLINGCRQGDHTSFTRLIDIYSKRCFGYFYRLTGNKEISEDLLSELFVKLVEKIGSYRGGSFDGWLFTMASNIFHDNLRFRQRQAKLLDEHRRRLDFAKKEDDNINAPDADKLQIALGQLEEDVRELVMLRFYSQLSFKEISHLRSEPLGTVLSKVHRGLKRLRELMGEAINL